MSQDLVYLKDRTKRQFQRALGEADANQPDTVTACNLLALIDRHCTDASGGKPPKLEVALSVESPNTAALSIIGLPHVSLACCADLERQTSVADVRFQFESETTHQPLDRGCVRVQFWRASVANDARRRLPFLAQPLTRERTAEPDWHELNISEAAFAQDRALILGTMAQVYNMEALMPTGLTCRVEKTFARDFSRVGGKRKTSATAAAADDGAAAGDDDPSASEQQQGSAAPPHTGYAIYFSGTLPSLSLGFFTHLRAQIGPELLGCMVLMPSVRTASGGASRALLRRAPELVVSLRCAHALDEVSRVHAVCGSRRLARRLVGPNEQNNGAGADGIAAQ